MILRGDDRRHEGLFGRSPSTEQSTAAPTTAPAVIARLARRVERIVLLSSPHQTPHPFFQQPNPLATIHAGIDRLVADSGVAWTIIRPGMFAANSIEWWAPQIQAGDVVRWPYGAVETAPIDERDIAAIAEWAVAHADAFEAQSRSDHH